MKTLFAILTLALACFLVNGAGAGDKKEVTLKGKITCAKCDLDLAKACATVIVVKKDKKDLVYWFDAKAHGKHHGAICTTPTDGTVTGTVSKDGDKMVITVKSLEFDK